MAAGCPGRLFNPQLQGCGLCWGIEHPVFGMGPISVRPKEKIVSILGTGKQAGCGVGNGNANLAGLGLVVLAVVAYVAFSLGMGGAVLHHVVFGWSAAIVAVLVFVPGIFNRRNTGDDL